MAKYKRQKVKHYHRSFYSREMRVKRGIGIAVLVVAVLAAAWFAAPHVLDWATHTWYTVVKDRDLEAESASRAEAAASSAAASSAAASQAASEPEPEEEKPLDGKDITGGSWAELDVTALTDEAVIRAAARHIPRLDIADKVDEAVGIRLLQQMIGRAVQLVAFGVLRAVIEQRDARIRTLHRLFRVESVAVSRLGFTGEGGREVGFCS